MCNDKKIISKVDAANMLQTKTEVKSILEASGVQVLFADTADD